MRLENVDTPSYKRWFASTGVLLHHSLRYANEKNILHNLRQMI